jgi:serine/threonine protein kinase
MLMLSPNPRVRPTAHEALQHSWFKQDKEILKDLLNFNENLSKASLAYLRNYGSAISINGPINKNAVIASGLKKQSNMAINTLIRDNSFNSFLFGGNGMF